jgi:hypothetical protein
MLDIGADLDLMLVVLWRKAICLAIVRVLGLIGLRNIKKGLRRLQGYADITYHPSISAYHLALHCTLFYIFKARLFF